MARSTFTDVFLRLPPSTAVLLLSAAFGLPSTHALLLPPRQTKTVEFRVLGVIPFPPAPTEPPISPLELLRRQEENTICGFIGGDSGLPATCSAGSHCVLDPQNGVVGCCPNGGACTQGVFTGCVDGNSDPQTEVNPYIYTCQGGDVCYQNAFAGGFSQFGCGSASSLGTTVQTTADGITTSLPLLESSVSLTATPSSLSTPTTIGTRTSTSSSTSSSDSSSSSTSTSSSSSSSSSTTTTSTSTSSSESPSSTDAPPTSSDGSSVNRTAAIAGGTVAGVAVLIGILVALFFCLRKRRANNRRGPGPKPTAAPNSTEYMSPMRSHGAAWAPLPSWDDDTFRQHPLQGQQPPAAALYNQYSQNPYANSGQLPASQTSWPFQQSPEEQHHTYGEPIGMAPTMRGGSGDAFGFAQQQQSLPMLRGYHAAHVPGMGVGLAPVAEEEALTETVQSSPRPPTGNGREIDEFSRAYARAGIGSSPSSSASSMMGDGESDDEDRRPLRHSARSMTRGGNLPSTPQRDGEGGEPAGAGGVASPTSPHSRQRSSSRGGGGPLWQQNRQQARNLMWL